MKSHKLSDDQREKLESKKKLDKALVQMEEAMLTPNRRPPRFWGNCIVILRVNNQAVITIGPDWKFTLSLLAASVLFQGSLITIMHFVLPIAFYIGVLISIWQIGSFLGVALISSGHPSFEVTSDHVEAVKEKIFRWCSTCKIFRENNKTSHCGD